MNVYKSDNVKQVKATINNIYSESFANNNKKQRIKGQKKTQKDVRDQNKLKTTDNNKTINTTGAAKI